MLTPDIKACINKSVLCWLATADKSNMPNVSPKEMFTFEGDSTLLIAHIASPNSLKNIKANPQVSVSILDIFVQKGYQFKGYATIIDNKNPPFGAKAQLIIDLFGTAYPFTQIIDIDIQKVKPIIAPSYILFPESTEESSIDNAMKTYNVQPRQMTGTIIALSKSSTHTMRKFNENSLHLLTGLGVEGDAHNGVTVKHRSRVAQDPTQPNLRQIHLIHAELHDELKAKGFDVAAGQMGENITTRGIDLLNLPKGTRLKIGETVIEITGLRNPCHQLNGIQDGLLKAVLGRDEDDNLVRKAGIMGIVLQGGTIKITDLIHVKLPELPFIPLERV
jgi:MOSC domain-containing protein YiiM